MAAPLLSSARSRARRFPANVVYEDEKVAAALLCARFFFASPPALAGPLSRGPVARCPGARRGGWRHCCGWAEGRATDGASLGCGALYRTIPKTSRFVGVPSRPPAAAAPTGLLVLSGSPRFPAPPTPSLRVVYARAQRRASDGYALGGSRRRLPRDIPLALQVEQSLLPRDGSGPTSCRMVVLKP